MRLKDFIVDKYPEMISIDYYGGDYSCPDKYKALKHVKPLC